MSEKRRALSRLHANTLAHEGSAVSPPAKVRTTDYKSGLQWSGVSLPATDILNYSIRRNCANGRDVRLNRA